MRHQSTSLLCVVAALAILALAVPVPRWPGKIAEEIITIPASSVIFASIPQNFSHLRIEMQARTNRADAQLTDEIRMRFNGDAGPNYDCVHFLGESDNTRTSWAATDWTYIWIANVDDAWALPRYATQASVQINNYARTTFFKTALAQGIQAEDAEDALGLFGVWIHSGYWHNTEPITSIELFTANGDKFVTGSTFTLYGEP